MKPLTRLRASSALWVAPFALALPLFYYFSGQGKAPSGHFGYAPTIVSFPLAYAYSFAYAVASALAAWESARLKREGVWSLAPARSRYHVGGHALVPVIILSWLMLCLPVSAALIQTRTIPNADSLRPLGLALSLCVAHAVIGFFVGLRVPRLIAAPLLAVAVWVLVSFARTTQSFWLRHVSGYFGEQLMFGEVASFKALVPHFLFTGGIAMGIALLWMRLRPLPVRIVLACAIAVAGPTGAYSMAKGWGHTPPLLIGQAPMECKGHAPKVCMPKATAEELPETYKDAVSVLGDLRAAGIAAGPEVITDRIADGRFYRPSSVHTWRVGLSYAALRGNVRYQIGFTAVRFPCTRPDLATSRALRLWTANVIGEEAAERRRVAQETTPFDGQAQVQKVVAKVLTLPAAEQRDWYRRSLVDACRKGA